MIQRVGARAVLLTPENRILLMNIVEPRDEISFWITPGGGLDPGESAEEGLLRELMEEGGAKRF